MQSRKILDSSFISIFSRLRAPRQRDTCCETDPVPFSRSASLPRGTFSLVGTESWVTWSSSVEIDSSVVSRWKVVSGKNKTIHPSKTPKVIARTQKHHFQDSSTIT
jgi:hypothetical protein